MRDALDAASAIARESGLRAGLAVLDTQTGDAWLAGDPGPFAAASVVKPLIAARLLAEGRLGTGAREHLASRMIRLSDDGAANALWTAAGGPALEPWIALHYHIDHLGSPNTKPGFWGNTHLTATGLADFYAKAMADPKVGPWLFRRMAQMAPVAADGTNQMFGLAAAAPHAAVKQGWAAGSADVRGATTINSTGVVAGRFVVVILTEWPAGIARTLPGGFNPAQAKVATAMAARIIAALPAVG